MPSCCCFMHFYQLKLQDFTHANMPKLCQPISAVLPVQMPLSNFLTKVEINANLRCEILALIWKKITKFKRNACKFLGVIRESLLFQLRHKHGNRFWSSQGPSYKNCQLFVWRLNLRKTKQPLFFLKIQFCLIPASVLQNIPIYIDTSYWILGKTCLLYPRDTQVWQYCRILLFWCKIPTVQ